MRGRCAVLPAVLLVALTAPAPAFGFGTIDGGGQHREHERITRAALACTNGEPACFEPATMNYLAGRDREFGAVGAPDSDEMADPAAHCDDADYLAGGYPRSRDTAVAALTECAEHLRAQFRNGVDSAKGLLDDRGEVSPEEVIASPECNPKEREESRAKCTTLEAFGRVLHGAQDFYSHSNWADQADPARPIGDDNPPGLHRPGPSPLLDLRGTTAEPPVDFTTGCYVLQDKVPGVGACQLRITHAALNKDRGLIDPVTGRATEPGHRAGDGAGPGGEQLRRRGGRGDRREPSPVAGLPGRVDRPVRRRPRGADGLRPHPRRPGAGLPGLFLEPSPDRRRRRTRRSGRAHRARARARAPLAS